MSAESALRLGKRYGVKWYVSTQKRASSRYLPKIDGKVFIFSISSRQKSVRLVLGDTVLSGKNWVRFGKDWVRMVGLHATCLLALVRLGKI